MSDLRTYFDKFLHYVEIERNLSKATATTYRKALAKFEEFLQKRNVENIADITVHDLEYFIMDLKLNKLEVTSINVHISTIKSLYKYLIVKNFVQNDPSLEIQTLKRKKRLPNYFNADEMDFLLDQDAREQDTNHEERDLFVSTRDKAIVELLYATGIRVAELVGLDLNRYYPSERLIRVFGKGGKERIIPVGEMAIKAITEYLDYRKLYAKEDEQALFINERGTRTTTRNVSYRLKTYATTHDFKTYIHPHKLRHTFATIMLQNTHNIRAVQDFLGHAQLTSTQIYTHTDLITLTKEYDRAHPRDRIEEKLKKDHDKEQK